MSLRSLLDLLRRIPSDFHVAPFLSFLQSVWSFPFVSPFRPPFSAVDLQSNKWSKRARRQTDKPLVTTKWEGKTEQLWNGKTYQGIWKWDSGSQFQQFHRYQHIKSVFVQPKCGKLHKWKELREEAHSPCSNNSTSNGIYNAIRNHIRIFHNSSCRKSTSPFLLAWQGILLNVVCWVVTPSRNQLRNHKRWLTMQQKGRQTVSRRSHAPVNDHSGSYKCKLMHFKPNGKKKFAW